jgi:hypothetical protein
LSDVENGSRIQTVDGVEFVERDIGTFRYRPEVITFFNRVSLERGARDWDSLTSIGEGAIGSTGATSSNSLKSLLSGITLPSSKPALKALPRPDPEPWPVTPVKPPEVRSCE